MTITDPDSLRLAAIVQSSDDAIISTSTTGVIETWNRAAEQMFGYTAAEAIGRSAALIVPTERLEEERALITRLRRGEVIHHFETTALTKSGSQLHVSVSLSPVLTSDGELIGIARIARDRTQQRLLEREAFRLAAIIDNSDDAIISKDLNGVVRTWNRAAERMFGYTADEIVGRSITMIIPSERLAEEDLVLDRIRSGATVEHFETVRQRKDGSRIEISLTVSPIRTPDGRVIGASKIARDISPLRRLARELEQANRVKDEFLATLSHELRTPLNAVLGYTRMLRMGNVQPDRAIQVIERNANVLSQLVSDVLDVSAIVTGKIAIKPAPCDLAAVLDAALDSVRPSAETKGVMLRVDMARPAPVTCDADRLQQVFWNLLNNAVKFTSAGGRVDVRLEVNGDATRAIVADTGIGIRPDLLPYVFQRFWQGESVNSRERGGLGLGLALARHFVELHGGTIAATSKGEGHGATFEVVLPTSRVS